MGKMYVDVCMHVLRWEVQFFFVYFWTYRSLWKPNRIDNNSCCCEFFIEFCSSSLLISYQLPPPLLFVRSLLSNRFIVNGWYCRNRVLVVIAVFVLDVIDNDDDDDDDDIVVVVFGINIDDDVDADDNPIDGEENVNASTW